MQELLNRQLSRYGVRITGSNIPDVQLPTQYQQHLATRERVAKERTAYDQEWGLIRKRRIDHLGMDIERAKKVRDARIVEVKAALNRAREEVAQLLEQQETEAQRVRFEIETRGRSGLIAAENEARAQRALAKAYRDNRAVLSTNSPVAGWKWARSSRGTPRSRWSCGPTAAAPTPPRCPPCSPRSCCPG